LPGQPGRPGHDLPGDEGLNPDLDPNLDPNLKPGRPDQGLPPTAEPKE
jgi:hypothetical protein